MNQPAPQRCWLTPPAPAALAVVRLHAPCAVLARVSSRALPMIGAAQVAWVRDVVGTTIDEAVLVRCAEDVLELIVHGGPGVRAALDDCLEGHGFAQVIAGRSAEAEPPWLIDPGVAGSKRAWTGLAHAASPAAVRWLLAHPASDPDFDPEFLSRSPLVLITGPVNAGKSTLLNAWCGHQRAVVSPLAGTTRDLIAAETLIQGWRIRLFDSAGLRAHADALEHAGQELAITARTWADAVVVLSPDESSDQAVQERKPGDLLVHGRCDQRATLPDGVLWSASGLPGRSTAHLLDALGTALLQRLGLPPLPA